MNCLYCGHETKVTNSRPQRRLNQVWRRRKCQNCQALFTSLEAVDYSQSVRVIKPSGLETFNRDELFTSIYDSCKHRPTALSDAQALTTTVISQLLHQLDRSTISTKAIAQTAAEILRRFDNAAFVHYTAFHPHSNETPLRGVPE